MSVELSTTRPAKVPNFLIVRIMCIAVFNRLTYRNSCNAPFEIVDINTIQYIYFRTHIFRITVEICNQICSCMVSAVARLVFLGAELLYKKLCLFVCLTLGLSVCLSVCLSACLSVYHYLFFMRNYLY